jgi:succinyl-CoA synthetase alpha subunit
MSSASIVKRNRYFDSIFLMRIAGQISGQPGVDEAAVLMGTEKNKQILADMGLLDETISSAGPNDLMVALSGEHEATIEAILSGFDDLLELTPVDVGTPVTRTLEAALEVNADVNLAVISVPGEYAAAEARRALERGLNVFLFSANVSLEDEVALKESAQERGLIVMGPDCGTAIVAGIGLGFANVVRRGSIGVIGASGTGLQEFTSLVHQSGMGISHALGTGGRDLSDAVGGISALAALAALEADPETQVIALVSKPPGVETLRRLVPELNRCRKPVVTCFIGHDEPLTEAESTVTTAVTVDEAVLLAVDAVTGSPAHRSDTAAPNQDELIVSEKDGMGPTQKFVRGIFAGGTFNYQAQHLFRRAGLEVHSNAPIDGVLGLSDPNLSTGHTLVDMGDELFTEGRPHPMIDPTLRKERILREADDPEIAVLLLDFVLGYGAAEDPAGDLVEEIKEAKAMVGRRGGQLSVVASVCGTDGDPQDLAYQCETLEEAGVVLMPSSARAVEFSLALTSSRGERT